MRVAEPILCPIVAAVRDLRLLRAPEATSESSDLSEGQRWDPSPGWRSIKHRRVRRPLAFRIAEGMTYVIDSTSRVRNAEGVCHRPTSPRKRTIPSLERGLDLRLKCSQYNYLPPVISGNGAGDWASVNKWLSVRRRRGYGFLWRPVAKNQGSARPLRGPAMLPFQPTSGGRPARRGGTHDAPLPFPQATRGACGGPSSSEGVVGDQRPL